MNERVEDILLKAGTTGGHQVWFTRPEVKKFAELIIQECVDIAKHHVMNISTYADAEFVEKQIEKHFGVEE